MKKNRLPKINSFLCQKSDFTEKNKIIRAVEERKNSEGNRPAIFKGYG